MAVFLQEKIILILLQFIFLKNLALVVSQYSMTDSKSESFLDANFTETSDHIFPKNLEIIVYLSRRSGLLFYSIDKNLNQLIVSLQDTKIPTIKIEFRNEKYVLSLNDLCKCKWNSCLYEKLALKFQIINKINIQCNGGQANEHSFTNNKLPNDGFPIPSFYRTEITAFLWLINTPPYQHRDKTVYPSADYLTGCIFSVTYEGAPVQLNGQLENCVNQCKIETCNGGECIETYNLHPICNCTDAFLNGDDCNKTLTGQGEFDFQFEFNILKISLKFELNSAKEEIILESNCSKQEIKLQSNSVKQEYLRLSSREGGIAIYLSSSNELVVAYIYPNQSESHNNSMIIEHKTRCEISKNPQEKYILLLELDGKRITIKMKHNNSWSESSLNIRKIVSGAEFHKINSNLSDVAYKLSKNEIGWLPAKLGKNLRSKINVPGNPKSSRILIINEPALYEKSSHIPKTTEPTLYKDTTIIDILIYIVNPLILTSICGLFIYYRRFR